MCPSDISTDVVYVFKAVNQEFQLAYCLKSTYTGLSRAFFSPDSKTLVLLPFEKRSHKGKWMQHQYNAETGTATSSEYVERVSSRVAHFNWMLSRAFDAAGLGVPFENPSDERDGPGPTIYQGQQTICRIPPYLEWLEQAQIGGTHLFLASPKHGMVVLKMPVVETVQAKDRVGIITHKSAPSIWGVMHSIYKLFAIVLRKK